MNLASVSSTPPVASTCFRCRRAFIFSFSPSPLSLYFPRDSAWPRVRSLRTESDGARIGDTESYGSELLRRPLNSSEEEESSEEGDEFVDWEDKILEVTVPLVGFVRMILHSGKYVSSFPTSYLIISMKATKLLSTIKALRRHNHILLLCYLTVELEILSINLNPRNLEAFLVIRYRFGC